MRTPLLVAIVVLVHCIAIGSSFLIQGCGTTSMDTQEYISEPIHMPPTSTVESTPRFNAPPPAVISLPTPGLSERDASSYVVQKGDCLSKIASKHKVKVSDIMALNRLTNANMIRLGQKLMIPGRVDVDSPIEIPAPKARPTVVASGNAYVVQRGDCLSAIAQEHGVKTAALLKVNGLSDDRIYAGQKLVIPKGGIAPAPVSDRKAEEIPDLPVVDDPVPVLDSTVAVHGKVPAPAPADTAVSGVAVSFIPHTVEKDQDLYNIAMTYGVRVSSIRRLNGLSNKDTVKTGQMLKIPVSQ